MPTTLFASNYFSASLLTLLIPTILLSVLAVWYVVTLRHKPFNTEPASAVPTSAATAPDDAPEAADPPAGHDL